MGYKLAGFDVVAGVEIDPEMSGLYKSNLRPRGLFEMSIQDFNKNLESSVPKELKNIDVLDGSPPCSVFSMSGDREADWGKEKKFREGQAKQRLDDLFFHFIRTAELLRPKVVIAENVEGLVRGNAKGFVKLIFEAFDRAGYDTKAYILNSAHMGVPQARRRTFFIGLRSDLKLQFPDMTFAEVEIPAAKALTGVQPGKLILNAGETALDLWKRAKPGESFARFDPEYFRKGWGRYFNWKKIDPAKPVATIAANCRFMHWREPRLLTVAEVARLQTFPEDYDFGGSRPEYVCGMSVPPLMMQRIALRVVNTLRNQ